MVRALEFVMVRALEFVMVRALEFVMVRELEFVNQNQNPNSYQPLAGPMRYGLTADFQVACKSDR